MKHTHAKPIRWAAMWLLTLMAAGLGSLFSSGMTGPVFAYALAEEQGAGGGDELDGTKIEYFDIRWLTQSSALDNEGAAYARTDQGLFLATSSDAPLSMQFQVNLALSGHHDYAPGELKIMIPAQIWHPRGTDEQGKATGTADPNAYIGGMSLSVPQAPAAQTGYNWTLVEDEYIIANTQTLSAATQISFQFTINGIVPHMIVDRSTAGLTARCEVKTAQGNTLTRQSNTLTAEIDTIERVTQAVKSGTVYEDPPSAVTDMLGGLPAGANAGDYIYVQWMTYVRHEGNQPFSLSLADVLDTTVTLSENAQPPTTQPISGILLGGKVNGTALTEGQLAGKDPIVEHEYCTPKNYDHLATVWAAYPKASLPAVKGKDDRPVSYTLRNTADWTLTELDPAVGEDQKKTTTRNAVGSVVYKPVAWQEPAEPVGGGGFSHVKKNRDVSDYGYALNQLLGGNAVEHTYQLAIGGYGYPYTKDTGHVPEGGDENGPEAYGWKPWSQSVTDEAVTLDDRTLSAEDYEFTQVIVGVPGVSAWKKLSGGDYGYSADGTLPKPALTIEYKGTSGVWQAAAVARWGANGRGGFEFVQVAPGVSADNAARRLSFPAGTTGLRACYTSNVFDGETAAEGQCATAAVSWVITPTLRIKPSDANVAAAAERSRAGMSATLKNKSAMKAGQTGKTLAYIESTAATTLSGARYGVRLDKSLKSYQNDVEKQVITLRYSATMSLQTNLASRDEYDEAVAAGIIPAQTRGVWYDLLPEGASPVLSTVRLRSGDAITSVYTIKNYRGTGRILLVVEANLTPTPVSSSASFGGQVRGYADKPTLSFDALYPWSAYTEYGREPRNDVAFESLAELPDGILGTIPGYQGEPDDPLAGNNRLHAGLFNLSSTSEKQAAQAMTHLDTVNEGSRFVYAKAVKALTADVSAVSELSKKAATASSTAWSSGLNGEAQATVAPGEAYAYRLFISSATHDTRNIILYDSLESFAPSPEVESQQADAEGIAAKASWPGVWQGEGQWRGTLVSADLSDVIERYHAMPRLYYATQEKLSFAELSSGATQEEIQETITSGSYDLTNTAIWTEAPLADGVFTVPDGLRITAIAIDATKADDGEDFVLRDGQAFHIDLHMRAPEGQAAEDAYCRDGDGNVSWNDALSAANNMYAFNNARYVSRNVGTLKLARYDYTRVGIVPSFYQVNKAWNDQNNHDGIRPQSVTVTLMRKTMGSSALPEPVPGEDGRPWTLVLSQENDWKGLFLHLPLRDEGGRPYVYSVQEEGAAGYTGSISAGEKGQYALTNTHANEKVSLSGQKLWADDGDAAGARPASVTVTLLRDDKAYKSVTVTPDANGEWRYSFDNLDRYAPYDGVQRAYRYAVAEEYVPKYVSAVAQDGYSSVITNTYTPTGSLSISKTLEAGATGAARDKAFTFIVTLTREQTQAEIDAGGHPEPLPGEFPYTVYDKDGSPIEGRSGVIACGGRLTIRGGEYAVITGIPSESGYEVSEEPLSGFTCTGMTGEAGVIRAGETAQASFVNRYGASVSVPLYVTKTLEGGVIGDGQFRFELLQGGEVVSTATTGAGEVKPGETVLTSQAMAYFGRLSFTHADDGKSFDYVVREVDDKQPGYVYNTEKIEPTVTITLHDNGDGTMDYTLAENGAVLESAELAEFKNAYHASGSVALRAWKALHGRALTAGEFSFALYEFDNDNGIIGNRVGDVVTNDANGVVDFPALNFNQNHLSKDPKTPATYTCLMCELPGDDSTVDYTQDAYLVTLTVTDAGRGRLSIGQTMRKAIVAFDENGTPVSVMKQADLYTGAPVFTNTLYPGHLSVTKWVTGDNPPTRQFKFHLKLTGENVPEKLEVELSAANAAQTASAEDAPVMLMMLAGEDTQQTPAEGTGDSYTQLIPDGETGRTSDSYWNVWSDMRNSQAFARLNKNTGEMVFFRIPKDEYAQGYTYDGTAVPGNWTSWSRKGYGRRKESGDYIFYCEFEEDYSTSDGIKKTDYSSFWPWTDGYDRGLVKRVEVRDHIRPLSTQKMFSGMSNLEYADVGLLDTRNVKSMFAMFRGSANLKKVVTKPDDASRTGYFGVVNNTPWINDLYGTSRMFENCTALETVDVSGFAMDSPDCYAMFNKCNKLQELNFSAGFSTANSPSLGNMFQDCSSLKSLDLQHFSTGEKTEVVSGMFRRCTALESVVFGEGFTTPKVRLFGSMFEGCSSLTSLDISMMNMQSATEPTDWEAGNEAKFSAVKAMFKDCSSLETLVTGDGLGNAPNARYYSQMFDGCSSLKAINASKFVTTGATTMNHMFRNCKALTSLDLSSFTTGGVTNFQDMFNGCTFLTSLDIGNFDTSNATNTGGMFNNCGNVRRVVLGNKTRTDSYIKAQNKDNGTWIIATGGDTRTGKQLFTEQFDKHGVWVWNVPQYTIIFDGGEGAGSMPLAHAEAGKDYSFTPAFTHATKRLTGFVATIENADGTISEDHPVFPVGNSGDVLIPASANREWAMAIITLTAQWQEQGGQQGMENGEFEFYLSAGQTITFKNLPGGLTYEVWEDTPADWTLADPTNLNGTIVPNETREAAATNAYSPNEVSYVLRASKTMDGRPAGEGDFSFILTETTAGAAATPVTADTNAFGAVAFPAIERTYGTNYWNKKTEEVYTYEIREVAGSNPTIDYDPSVYTATVTVSKNSQGNLAAEVAYAKAGETPTATPPAFANTTRPGSLVIEKTAANAPSWTDSASAQAFTFDVTLTDSVGIPLGGTFAVTTEEQDGSGEPVLSEITLSGGQGALTLKKGQKATISGLPAGTRYTVTEREKPGFTATASGATGTIPAANTSTATFANGYEAKGVANIAVKKALEGRALTEGEFTFALYLRQGEQTETPVDTAANAADGTVRFAAQSYTQEGTYSYVIREIIPEQDQRDPSIDYSTQALSVTVEMRDLEGEGRLTAVLLDKDGHVRYGQDGKPVTGVTITDGDGDQHDTLTNRVKKGALTVSKTVVPEAAGAGKAFAFTLTLKDAGGSPLTGSYTAVPKTGEAFTLTPDAEGVCSLTLAHGQSVTIEGLPEGTTYAVAETSVPGYAASSTGEAGTIHQDGTAHASFTNTYSAKGSYTFTASKTLTGREMTAGQFRFMLEELDDAGEPTGKAWRAVNAADGSVTLATLDFTDADLGENGSLIRDYRVTEINESAAGYVYDAAVHTVKLTVEDNRDGTLKFSARHLSGKQEEPKIAFANSYSNEIDISATKVWQGDAGYEEMRRDVTLTLQRRAGDALWSAVDGSEKIIPASAAGDGLKVTWENLPRFDAEGRIIEYRVVETMAGYTAETNPYESAVTGTAETGFTVTNRYARAELTLAGSKTLSGRSLADAPAFSFVLKQGNAVLQTVQNADGQLAFAPLVYTLADLRGVSAGADGTRSRTFRYTVSEVNDGKPGYTYDPGVYDVTVALTESVNGLLSAKVTEIRKGEQTLQGLSFANAYQATGACALRVQKKLAGGEISGRVPRENEFTFSLFAAGDSGEPVGEPLQTKKNAADGTVSFDLAFTQAGAYRYVICEAEGSDDTIVYSQAKVLAEVVMRDEEGKGSLTAQVTYSGGGGEDHNILTNTVKPGSLQISKRIIAGGSPLTEAALAQEFTFRVTLRAGEEAWSGQVMVGTQSTTTDAYGRLTVTMKGGESVRISGIPAGISYAISEELAEGSLWTLVEQKNPSGTIRSNQTSQAGFVNRYDDLIEISATKVWREDTGYEALRPDVTLCLMRKAGEGEWTQVSAKTVKGDAPESARTVTWTGLPQVDQDGAACVYRVEEAPLDLPGGDSPYESAVTGTAESGFTVTNRLRRTSFTVNKQWRGEEGGPISLTLYANGERMEPQPVCRRAGNVYTYDGLLLCDGRGYPIVYSAKEAYMEGYLTIYCNRAPYDEETRMIYDGGTIVNREVLDVRVQKVWQGLSPDMATPRITLTLLCNGQPVDRGTPVPDRNGWYCYTNLPAYDANGQRAVYTVVEAPMSSCVTAYAAPDGSPADCAKDGYTITNTYLPETGDRSNALVWPALGIGSALGALLLVRRRRRASPDDR